MVLRTEFITIPPSPFGDTSLYTREAWCHTVSFSEKNNVPRIVCLFSGRVKLKTRGATRIDVIKHPLFIKL